VSHWDIYYKYNKYQVKKQGEDYLKLKIQNAECNLILNVKFRGSSASEYYIASLTKINAKPYLPFPREGDHS
jgi:hypothetical protein